jgi:hypothetical protein
VDLVLLFVESWWWAVPVIAGVGAVVYGAVTTNGRRARRLELDAARLEERNAIQTLIAARADARTAKSEVLAARARRDAPRSALTEAQRRAAESRDLEWSASLNLRAARSRVRAARMQYHSRAADAPLPIEALVARHDAVTARWLEYETDPTKALAFPQMLDSQHPATLAFLRAQRDAQQLRPTATRDRVSPAVYLAYRDAVAAEEAAFEAAERDALGLPRESAPGFSWTPMTVSLPSWLPRAAEVLRTVADVASTLPGSAAPRKTDPPTAAQAPWPPPAWRSAPPPPRR